MERYGQMVEKVGRALAKKKPTRYLALYGAVADADLAGGAPINQGNAAMNWDWLVKLHDAVRSRKLATNSFGSKRNATTSVAERMTSSFMHSICLRSKQTWSKATVTSVLGMRVQASTLVPNGTAYAVDTRVASVMLLRRDITVEDWEDIKNGKYGVRATTRFGIGVLRSNAIAKMTNIATTLS